MKLFVLLFLRLRLRINKENTLKDVVDSIDEPVAVEMNFPIPYQILWDIGRRCNYD